MLFVGVTNLEQAILLSILLIGLTIALSTPIRAGLNRVGIPALVGYIGLGMVLSILNQRLGLISEFTREIFEFLANVGIIILLFRVGLECDLAKLLSQLRRASFVWVVNFLFSGVLGFVTARSLLHLDYIPSLFVGTALTATSVGIAVAVWQEASALDSANGELLVDVAEMDDISAVILMALLFAVVRALRENPDAMVSVILATTAGSFLIRAVCFGAFCYLFSRYIERNVTRFYQRLETTPAPVLPIVGIGFIIAALAGLLGFSVAIGAFFAGLVFSRDPEAVRIDASFSLLYAFFVPFFFIGIGLKIVPVALSQILIWGLVLSVAGVVGKVVGAGFPVLVMTDWRDGIVLGTSMVPRAEIVMVVMQHGLLQGEWAVSQELFSAMTVVVIVTSIFAPLALRHMLLRWPQVKLES